MRKITMIFALLLAAVSLQAQTGEEIFEAKCAACHLKTAPMAMNKPGAAEFMAAMSKLKAPPFSRVTMRLKGSLQSKEKFVAFVADYIANPSKEKALCNPMAVKKFGLMPPVAKTMSKEERTKVAEWMYNRFEMKACPSCASCKSKMMKCGEGKCGSEMKTPKKTPKKTPESMKCAPGKCGGM